MINRHEIYSRIENDFSSLEITNEDICNMNHPKDIEQLHNIMKTYKLDEFIKHKKIFRYCLKFNVFDDMKKEYFLEQYCSYYLLDPDFLDMLNDTCFDVYDNLDTRMIIIDNLSNIYQGNVNEVLMKLIDLGIDINYKYCRFTVEYSLFSFLIHPDIIKYIIDKYPEVLQSDVNNILCMAIRQNHNELCDYILSFDNINITVNSKDNSLFATILDYQDIDTFNKIINHCNFKFTDDYDYLEEFYKLLRWDYENNCELLIIIINVFDIEQQIANTFDRILQSRNVKLIRYIINNYVIQDVECNIFEIFCKKNYIPTYYNEYNDIDDIASYEISHEYLDLTVDLLNNNHVKFDKKYVEDINLINMKLHHILLEHDINLFEDSQYYEMIINNAFYLEDKEFINLVIDFNYDRYPSKITIYYKDILDRMANSNLIDNFVLRTHHESFGHFDEFNKKIFLK